jgi:HD-like signal output (HDOD) protein
MKLLSEFMQFAEMPADDISVHSLFSDFDDEDNSLLNHLYRNLMDNSIKLPSLPSVAGRIQQIYKGRSTDADAMLRILISYPDISKKIINIARFAEKTELRRTEKIRNSIRRLGMRSVYCLVMTYSVGKLVKRLPENHMHRVSSFWEHSLSVAAISRVLAKQCTEFPPDLAMLAGLVHGIGVLAIDDRLLEHHPLKLDHIEIDHAIQVMRPEISGLLLRKWNFSDDLICVAEECGDWSREHEGPADLCDLVLIANYYGLMKSDKNHSLPRANAIPSIKKLGITPEMSINAIRESAIVVRNIKKLFT